MKIEIYEIPQMRAANFNRFGGLMEVSYQGNEVRVVQRMPNPASGNLPWPVVADAKMLLQDFEEFIKPAIVSGGGKLWSGVKSPPNSE